jgi:two-component system OmpR family response regulator
MQNPQSTEAARLTSPARVLLVEDDLVTANLYCNALVVAGYAVELARTSAEAITILQKCETEVVVTDLMLPGDVNGIQLIQYLRETPDYARTPVIVLSNFKPDVLAGQAWKAGANFCLPKNSCDRESFLAVVKKAVARSLELRQEAGNTPTPQYP